MAERFELSPEQASLVAMLAQAHAEGADLDEFEPLLRNEDPRVLNLVKLLFGEISVAAAEPGNPEIVEILKSWVISLPRIQLKQAV